MMRAIIAEDEDPQRAQLIKMLAQLWPELQLVAECSDGVAALEALQEHNPNVAFLDIRMPGVSGLEVARAATKQTLIVFTTAYDEHAVEAFERGAIDYLLKPVRRNRLENALNRVRDRLDRGATPDLSTLLATLTKQLAYRDRPDAIKWIMATLGNTTRMFAVEDVLLFQARDKYTRVVTATDEAYIRTPIRDLLLGLDPDAFWQVHRGTIVRVGAIQAVERKDDKLTLRLKGIDEPVAVSSSLQHRFRGM